MNAYLTDDTGSLKQSDGSYKDEVTLVSDPTEDLKTDASTKIGGVSIEKIIGKTSGLSKGDKVVVQITSAGVATINGQTVTD